MMSKKYTITLTDSENKAMEHIAYSVQEWIDNAVKNRARIAKEEIYNVEIERMNADPSIDTIPANLDQVVLDADIRTAKQFTDETTKKMKEF
jgi:hypothetical protein